jgi:hypothetical protein
MLAGPEKNFKLNFSSANFSKVRMSTWNILLKKIGAKLKGSSNKTNFSAWN